MITLIFTFFACSHSASRLQSAPTTIPEECGSIVQSPSPTIEDILQPFQDQMNAGKTGVHILEDGTGALAGRAWLTEKLRKRADSFFTGSPKQT